MKGSAPIESVSGIAVSRRVFRRENFVFSSVYAY